MGAWLCAELIASELELELPPVIGDDGTYAELAAWLETLKTQGSAGPGRPSTFDLNAFFQSLVGFWDRNMNFPAPQSRRPYAESRKNRVSFHDFATAAARDARCPNAALAGC